MRVIRLTGTIITAFGLAACLACGPAVASTSSAGSCASDVLSVGNADNGKTLCVRPGTIVVVRLTNATSPVEVTGPLMPMVTFLPGDWFLAERPGTATITSVLSPCSTAIGPVHCMVRVLYRVTIKIRQRFSYRTSQAHRAGTSRWEP